MFSYQYSSLLKRKIFPGTLVNYSSNIVTNNSLTVFYYKECINQIVKQKSGYFLRIFSSGDSFNGRAYDNHHSPLSVV